MLQTEIFRDLVPAILTEPVMFPDTDAGSQLVAFCNRYPDSVVHTGPSISAYRIREHLHSCIASHSISLCPIITHLSGVAKEFFRQTDHKDVTKSGLTLPANSCMLTAVEIRLRAYRPVA